MDQPSLSEAAEFKARVAALIAESKSAGAA